MQPESSHVFTHNDSFHVLLPFTSNFKGIKVPVSSIFLMENRCRINDLDLITSDISVTIFLSKEGLTLHFVILPVVIPEIIHMQQH